ncbi:M14 family zinc carboxypeptidase [Streptomyces sp. NBC_01186]|uniref:M14 family zinc carboxypeptidase n=1 Tax=unclassified Streptomyces TaxID=2593676 RepID=UPI002DDC4656|nr:MULTISPECIES: M14 family zinc carboxypeptidase [unclassified Streptomyces]WSB76950.1 M14 family zinc carboxypeptidase [Streptomyces sp. NBC_01775]WSS14776.1 M14 family zinc carboxypeptidase [Streptomyces sp. NBC_01186]
MATVTPRTSPPDADQHGPWTGQVHSVPATGHYPDVDELLASFRALAERHPGLIREHRIGTSRLGEPLYCFTVRDGQDPAAAAAAPTPASTGPGEDYVVVGGVHPNEPVGAVTALHLATRLCEDDRLRAHFGAAWHIVPCVDPDGARLNEGWFGTPADKYRYGRHFYRPRGDEQVEWTFPFAYKDAYFDRVLPETLALMRLLDATRPRFLTTLHNCEAGGVYYFLNRPAPELYDQLTAIPAAAGIPLATGEPEAAHTPVYAPAIHGAIDMRTAYDYLESHGGDPASVLAGASSAAYTEAYGTFCFVAEVPHWSHPDSEDDTPGSQSYPQVLRQRADGLREAGEFLEGILEAAGPELTIASPFLRASRAFVPGLRELSGTETARAATLPERPATVSECYSCAQSMHSLRVRFGGMLLRALEAETTAGTATRKVRELRATLLERYDQWAAESGAAMGEPLPIATLSGVQYAALLAAADHARTEGQQPQ